MTQAVSATFFHLKWLLSPAKPAMTQSKKSDLWPDLWRHHWLSNKISQDIPKVHVRGYQKPLYDFSRHCSLADRGGTRPHYDVWLGILPTGRGLTRKPLRYLARCWMRLAMGRGDADPSHLTREPVVRYIELNEVVIESFQRRFLRKFKRVS